jgi:hypothetical protein
VTQRFEERIDDTLSELARSCRSMINRARTIAELACADRSLGVQCQRADGFAKQLASALESLGAPQMPGEGPRSLARPFQGLDLRSTTASMLSAKLPSPAGTIPSQPALKGSSSFMAISDLIGFLGTLSSTGTLSVTTLGESFTIVLQSGRITGAVSDRSPAGEKLGDILVERGALSQRRLASFLLRNRSSKRKLGEALILEEQVTDEELSTALQEQVRRLFMRLFESEDATFEFLNGVCPEEAIAVKMSVPGLLLESAVSIDHSHRGGLAG